jgi:2-oxoglutarate/2-oxoacid ferredoxin oxidoreductase subunit alpha
MKGNEAIAEAAIQAGCRFFFGYPITPQNQIPEYMSKRLPQVGGCFLQAESEVAAINMVYGAGGAGARVMTSSSSPGISLKQEGISYIVGAEVPCVIVNMVRGGPGLGSIQPAQSDYYQATRGGGHGDYRMCVLAPGSVQEAVDLTQDAFDIADRYRNPVLVLGDGLIGQMMEPVDMDRATNRAPAADLTEKNWAADGHIPTEESPRAIINSLYIDPQVLENHCKRLQAKYNRIAANECRWQEEMLSDAEIVLVAYGTTSRVARSAMRKCREKGVKVGMLRPITLWPFPEAAIRKTLATAKDYLTVEMSQGQMVDDVRLAVNGERPVHFYGRTGGMVPTVSEIVAQIEKLAGVAPEADGACECDFQKTMDDAAAKLNAAAETVGKKLEAAGKKIEETLNGPELRQKAKDAAEKIDAAAETVGKKLGETGKKIGETVSGPEFQQKAQDIGKQAGDFATRTADTVVKGVAGVFGAIGKVLDKAQKDLKEIENQQKAEKDSAGETKPDHDGGKEGE